MKPTINAAQIIDDSRLGPYQLLVIALCGLCLVMDGFDVQAMGYVAPVVIHEWGIAKETLSPVFGAGLFGMLIGSLVFSALADKIGRRPVLIFATLCFAMCMMATGTSHSITELIGFRFAAGLGLGCIMPNAMALAGEYSPRRLRVTLMMIVSCGFTLGGVVGGLITAWLIPHFGWRSVFYVGGALPFILGIVMWVGLPESIQFLVAREGRDDRVRRNLKRVIPGLALPDNAVFRLVETPAGVTDGTSDQPIPALTVAKTAGLPFIDLFRDGRATVTALLWIVNFANLLDMYFLSNWLPTVMHEAGFSVSTSVLAGTMLWTGGVIGTLLLGRIIDRLGFANVLAGTFVIAICAVAAVGNSVVIATGGAVFAAIFFAGLSIMGGQPALNALAATYYPTSLRSTGIGWSLGMGRVGSVIGPVLGGSLMHLQWSTSSLFLAAAVPACVSLAGVIGIGFATRRAGRGIDARGERHITAH